MLLIYLSVGKGYRDLMRILTMNIYFDQRVLYFVLCIVFVLVCVDLKEKNNNEIKKKKGRSDNMMKPHCFQHDEITENGLLFCGCVRSNYFTCTSARLRNVGIVGCVVSSQEGSVLKLQTDAMH